MIDYNLKGNRYHLTLFLMRIIGPTKCFDLIPDVSTDLWNNFRFQCRIWPQYYFEFTFVENSNAACYTSWQSPDSSIQLIASTHTHMQHKEILKSFSIPITFVRPHLFNSIRHIERHLMVWQRLLCAFN